jgi:Type VI secretion system/phage-baseplate injector OB domain
MSAPMESLNDTVGEGTRYYGKYRGKVSNVDDPSKLGRIKALVPSVLGEEETGWALPSVPFAGPNMGLYTIPPVDSGVWIEFEAGDPSLPVWTGCFWSSGQLPKDESGTEATPPLKIIQSEKGLLVALNDDSQIISISDANGTNLLKIEAQGGQITLQAQTKVVVEAPQIELIDGASHPLVFGDELMSYLSQLVTMFNTHLHPGELAAGVLPVTPAPPVPPLQPPTPSLLSVKVKTG